MSVPESSVGRWNAILKIICILCLIAVLLFTGRPFDEASGLVIDSEFDTGSIFVYIEEVSFRQDSDAGWTDADVVHVKTARGTTPNVDFSGLTLKPDEKAYFRIRIRCGASSFNAYTRAVIYSYACEYDAISNTIGGSISDIQPAVLSLSDVRGVYDDGSSFPMQFSSSSMTDERTVMLFNRLVEPGHYFDLYFDVDPSSSDWILGDSAMCVDFEIDAIQEHNAEDAIWDAWGMTVIRQPDGTICLEDSDIYPVSRYWAYYDLINVHFPVNVPCTLSMGKQVRAVDS